MTRGKSKKVDRKGERNNNAKLTLEQVQEIRALRASLGGRKVRKTDPRSCASLAQRFGVNRNSISKIAMGKRWMHIK